MRNAIVAARSKCINDLKYFVPLKYSYSMYDLYSVPLIVALILITVSNV